MDGIDSPFHRLQVIAFLQAPRHVAAFRRHHRPFEGRCRRLEFRRSHIGPDHIAQLQRRVGLQFDLRAHARYRGQLDALSGDIVFPAVIGAPQAGFLVAAEPQRDAAMGAELIDQPDLAFSIAKSNHLLRQRGYAHRRAIGSGQFVGAHDGDPVTAKQLAHGRPRAGLGQNFIFFA